MMHQLPVTLPSKLEDQRRVLIQFLENQRPQGSLNNAMTVVFDGKADIFGGMESSSMNIIFSKDETADDKIKRMVAALDNAKSTLVVTNDKEIQCAVNLSGAKAISVQAFLSQGRPTRQKVTRRSASSHKAPVKKMARNVETKITEEMEKIWLNKK
ncbi:hypothetical protein MNBD_UNCLBAC01-1646 [hydrothermal vent metagenome]|uniref:YacP-like NYN domain protein n=1 Tax=hydrothermal vent metagenome TaxID=652676 RepID=A0A3B1E4Q7_9ZZZZ